MKLSKKTKRAVLIIAAILILAAIFLYFIAQNSNSYKWISDELSRYSMNIDAKSFVYEGNASNTSIRELLVTDDNSKIEEAVNASKESGFASDIDAVGNIVFITSQINRDEELNLYILENEDTPMHIALCYIQDSVTGKVRAVQ